MENITKEQYEDYEAVRVSGVTNMFAVGTVCDLSGLSRDEVKTIMKNYSALKEQFDEEQNFKDGDIVEFVSGHNKGKFGVVTKAYNDQGAGQPLEIKSGKCTSTYEEHEVVKKGEC